MSSTDKSKSPILEQKMNKENSLEISDPVLNEFYKGLNESQQVIIKKLPEERRIEFLTFAKDAKEHEAGKLEKMNSAEKDEYFKRKELRKQQQKERLKQPIKASVKQKKKISSPLEDFLENKKLQNYFTYGHIFYKFT